MQNNISRIVTGKIEFGREALNLGEIKELRTFRIREANVTYSIDSFKTRLMQTTEKCAEMHFYLEKTFLGKTNGEGKKKNLICHVVLVKLQLV